MDVNNLFRLNKLKDKINRKSRNDGSHIKHKGPKRGFADFWDNLRDVV